MSRDKSVWFAEEILLDAKLINYQLDCGQWEAVEEMLRAEAQLSRDAETGRLRPKKASEYTLRLIAEVLNMMTLEAQHDSLSLQVLGVAEQCLRLVRCCAAAGTKIQTFICKELSILDSMLALSAAYHRTSPDDTQLYNKFTSLMKVLMESLGNLVVNNPYNQITVWDKLDSVIVEELVAGGAGAHAAAMLLYNILLGQPHILPAQPLLLNALAELHATDSEYPALILECLVAGDAAYLDKLYPHLDNNTRALLLAHANSLLTHFTDSQEVCVSVSFVRLMATEFKLKSDLILKTVDKYVCDTQPGEVMVLLENLGVASSIELYLDALQSDTSLLINCAFLLRAVHKLGKESNNFFSSINKLTSELGVDPAVTDNNKADTNNTTTTTLTTDVGNSSSAEAACCGESQSCTESESSEQFYECIDTVTQAGAPTHNPPSNERKASVETEAGEPPLILEVGAHAPPRTVLLHPDYVQLSSSEVSPEEPLTEIQILPASTTNTSQQQQHTTPQQEITPPQQTVVTLEDIQDEQETSPRQQPPQDQSTTDTTQQQQTTPASAQLTTPPSASLPHSAGPSRDESASPPLLLESITKSQNLSADFNLGEQLEKILGISSEKARSGGGAEQAGGGAGVRRAPPTVKIDPAEPHRCRASEEVECSRRVLTEVQTVEQHVAFGLKAALVRLVANLCWRHSANKRTVRECELIPVLLDCCSIDARNPYIMQWVIYALRNLCENCADNQRVVAELSGPLESSVLLDMGLPPHAAADKRANNNNKQP